MNYRNKELLNFARNIPYCMACKKSNDGTIIAAHSNSLTDGKGTGIKASDSAIAYICHECHNTIDNSNTPKDTKRTIWLEASLKSYRYMIENGILKLAKH